MSRAIYYYETAAARGLLAAQNNLGTIYRDGRGVKQNYKVARDWFRKARRTRRERERERERDGVPDASPARAF